MREYADDSTIMLVTEVVNNLSIAEVSIAIAGFALMISIVSYSLSRNIFKVSSRRLAHESAESHVKCILNIVTEAKMTKNISKKSWDNKTEVQREKYIDEFERRIGKMLTELNISCSAFTRTRGLSFESFADLNIGVYFCEFIDPHYETLNIIHETKNKYSDILALYELWSVRHKINILKKTTNEIRIKSNKINNKLIRMHLRLMRLIVASLPVLVKARTITRNALIAEAINAVKELRSLTSEYNEQAKVVRKQIRVLKKSERMVRHQVEKMRPLGL